jgi:hypothetical protein
MRNKYRPSKSAWLFIGIAIFFYFLILALPSLLAGDPDDQRVFDARLRETDLPAPWFDGHGSPQITIVDGKEELFYFFHHNRVPDLLHVMIGENLTLYANEEEAHEGYVLKLGEGSPSLATDWQENPPALQFVHHADELESRCIEGSVDGHHHYACRMLCRYGRLVIGVLGNVYEDQWLTMEEFRQVLIAADERATAAMEDERQAETGK